MNVDGAVFPIAEYQKLERVIYLINILNTSGVKEQHLGEKKQTAIKRIFGAAKVSQVCMSDKLIYILCQEPSIHISASLINELNLILQGKINII